MSLQRPTLQGRAGFNPTGYGPGINAPFGRSPVYFGGSRSHNGQDYFWLGGASASRLGISTAASLGVYPVLAGTAHPISSASLGTGVYQQLDSSHRVYYWHLSARTHSSPRTVSTATRIGTMGHTGSAAGNQNHLHMEIRHAPYGSANRIDPEPFFKTISAADKARYEKIAAFLNPHAVNVGLPKTTTAYDGEPGKNYWKLVQAVARAWGFYGGAVDGIPGNLTYAAEGRLWGDYVNKPKPVLPPEPAPEPEPEPIVIVIDPPADAEPEPIIDLIDPPPASPAQGFPDPPLQDPKDPKGAGWIVAGVLALLISFATFFGFNIT